MDPKPQEEAAVGEGLGEGGVVGGVGSGVGSEKTDLKNSMVRFLERGKKVIDTEFGMYTYTYTRI